MSSSIPFAKFESTGNDFIMVDNRSGKFSLTNGQIAQWCHRWFGTGADGLILLESHPNLPFRMRYYNSDGNEASFCGNGGRAICAFAVLAGVPGSHFIFEAFDGEHYGEILNQTGMEWQVSLRMKDVLTESAALIDTGSPHLIVEAPELNNLDVKTEGARLRNDDAFQPGGCNVNFVRYMDGALWIRTYERGVENETLSCGTGVTAAAIHHHLKSPDGSYSIPVQARGGSLHVRFIKAGDHFSDIYLTGPTRCVFQGEYYL
jgi:diaminopimelate epimerase